MLASHEHREIVSRVIEDLRLPDGGDPEPFDVAVDAMEEAGLMQDPDWFHHFEQEAEAQIRTSA